MEHEPLIEQENFPTGERPALMNENTMPVFWSSAVKAKRCFKCGKVLFTSNRDDKFICTKCK